MRLRTFELRLILFGLVAGSILWLGISRLGTFLVARVPATRDLPTAQLLAWLADPRFFVADGARLASNHPWMPAQSFTAIKTSQDFRVFLVGESQAMGTPYVQMQSELDKLTPYLREVAAVGGIATWMEEYLQVLMPDRRVQVVNAAIASQNMTAAAAAVEQIAEVGSPDLIVVLSGNGESFNVRYRSMAELEQALDRIGENFAYQLKRISDCAAAHRIPTYILTVPTSLRDWLPHWEVDRRTYELIGRKEWSAALSTLPRVEGNEALESFLRARSRPGEPGAGNGLQDYLAAKDTDFNLIRAHSRLNDLIRRSANEFVKVLDLEIAIRQYAEGGVPGFELLHDYCHFTLRGNVVAAREVVLFHQQQSGAPPRELPILDPRQRMQRKLKNIYKIELHRWTRLRHVDIPTLVDLNTVWMAEYYQQLNAQMERAGRGR